MCSCPYIEKVNNIKYLGVKLDQHLRWKDNIEYIYNRLRGLIPKFYSVRDILSPKNLHVIYSALAESVVRYCILIWGGVFQESLNNMNVVQNTLLKILFKKDRAHSTEMLYAEVGVLNVRQLYTFRCLMWMFEIRDSWDTSTSLVHITRCAQHLEVPFFRMTHLQRFPFFQAPKLYNSLPVQIKTINTKNKYRKEVHKHIKANYKNINEFFSCRY